MRGGHSWSSRIRSTSLVLVPGRGGIRMMDGNIIVLLLVLHFPHLFVSVVGDCPDCLSKSAGNVMVVGVFTDTTRNSCMMSLPVCLFYPRLILSIADLFSIVIHSFPIYFFEFFKLCWLRLLSYKTARNLFPALAYTIHTVRDLLQKCQNKRYYRTVQITINSLYLRPSSFFLSLLLFHNNNAVGYDRTRRSAAPPSWRAL